MKIKEKLELYHALLEASVEDYTESDIDIMYCLAKDPEIQRVLEKGKERFKP